MAVREFQRFRPSLLEAIEIDGRTAYLRDGRLKCLFWVCDGLSYEVSSVTGDDPLREISASIGCS